MQEVICKLEDIKISVDYEFQISNCYWVEVTHINNPHDFYVRKLGCSKYLKYLQKKGEPITLQDLNKFPTVVYKSKTLKKYARGQIKTITNTDSDNSYPRINLFAIDYGCIDNLVPMNRVWLPINKTNIQPLAVPCKLHLCMPIEDQWSEKDIEGMKFFVGNDSVQIRVCGRDEQAYIVEMYSGGPDDVSTLMMYTGCSNFGYIANSVNKIDITKPLTPYFRNKKLINGDKLHVRVLNGKSLKSFYVAQVDDYRGYRANLNDFKDYCRLQKSPKFNDIQVGHSYAVFLIGENAYERGVVKKFHRNGKLEVFLVDKGDIVTVPYEHIRIIKGEMYYELCCIAIHCCAEDSQVWDNGLHKFLYPGFEFYIVIKEVTDGKSPNTVNILPLE